PSTRMKMTRCQSRIKTLPRNHGSTGRRDLAATSKLDASARASLDHPPTPTLLSTATPPGDTLDRAATRRVIESPALVSYEWERRPGHAAAAHPFAFAIDPKR